jgi:hypothetical protein
LHCHLLLRISLRKNELRNSNNWKRKRARCDLAHVQPVSLLLARPLLDPLQQPDHSLSPADFVNLGLLLVTLGQFCAGFLLSRVFLEETSLVARPPVGFQDLKERLDARLKWLGIKVRAALPSAPLCSSVQSSVE